MRQQKLPESRGIGVFCGFWVGGGARPGWGGRGAQLKLKEKRLGRLGGRETGVDRRVLDARELVVVRGREVVVLRAVLPAGLR